MDIENKGFIEHVYTSSLLPVLFRAHEVAGDATRR